MAGTTGGCPAGGLSVLGQMGFSWAQSEDLARYAAAPSTPDDRFRYVILQDSAAYMVDDIRAANPLVKVLVYKNLGGIRDSAPERVCPGQSGSYYPFQGGGVHYCDAAPGHEDWFLHAAGQSADASHRLHPNDAYAGEFAMANLASSAYRDRWIANVQARLADANGDGATTAAGDTNPADDRFDGVFIDDANLAVQHGLSASQVGEAALDSDAEYSAATSSFLTQIAGQLGSGKLVLANVGLNRGSSAQRSTAAGFAGNGVGVNVESFAGYAGNPVMTGSDWRGDVEYLEAIQARPGGWASAISYGAPGDVERQRYAYASFLMAWDGELGSALAYRGEGAQWEAAWGAPGIGSIGYPRAEGGQRVETGGAGTNHWRRYFSNGVALVNASPTATASWTNLAHGPYAVGSSCIDDVSLPARSARVLTAC